MKAKIIRNPSIKANDIFYMPSNSEGPLYSSGNFEITMNQILHTLSALEEADWALDNLID